MNLVEDLGMTARLANDSATVEEKKAIIDERVKVNELVAGDILDSTGTSIFTGENFADADYFQAAMQGGVFVTEPIISEDQSSMALQRPYGKKGLMGQK